MKPLPRYFDGIRVPKYVFIQSLVMLMLLSGVHVGLILLLYRINVDSIVLVHVVLLYWVAVAIGRCANFMKNRSSASPARPARSRGEIFRCTCRRCTRPTTSTASTR